MRLHIIRHADPDYANNTITPTGHREAAALADRWRTVGLDRIYSSPLGRAIHTAQYTADALGLSVNVEPWTAELGTLRFGEQVAGINMIWDLPGELLRTDPEFARTMDPFTMPPLNVADWREEVERVRRDSDAFLARLGYQREGGRYRILRSHTENIAVFCHGGLGLTWLAHLLELPLVLMWSGFWIAPSSVTTILMDERSKEWATPRAICVGDTSHLHAAGLTPQPAGIKANFA